MARTADVLVIGAGMAGVGAAARLAPERRVVVLEMEERPAYHTTGRSAATFILNYGNAVLRLLNRASEEVLRTGCGGAERGLLTPRGELIVAAEGQEAQLDRAMQGASGMEEIGADEAVRLFPLLRRDRIARAAVERDASDIDVDALLQAFLRTLRARPSRFRH